MESYLTYSFYDKDIKPYNLEKYEKDFKRYYDNYQRLKKFNERMFYIKDFIDDFYSGNDAKTIKKDIEYMREQDLNAKTDFFRYDFYEHEFERVYNQIKPKRDAYLKEQERIRKKKEREEREREREERERERRERERENRNYHSNYNSSSSSSNSDMKKSYIKLCSHCKNSCVSCKREIKGSEIRTGKAFGLHNKCKIDSCYICGTSKSSNDVKERQSSYLCKSCYNSNKLDWTKCLSCNKQFK